MARIRTIKPEFWTSEQVVSCSPIARLMFVGLWTFSDDAGRHTDSAARIKMEVFPADQFSLEQIEALIAELAGNGLIERYDVDGQRFIEVTGWSHQKIDQPTYRHPNKQGFVERSPNKRRTVPECSPRETNGTETSGDERNGTERKGVEGNVNKGVGARAAPADADALKDLRSSSKVQALIDRGHKVIPATKLQDRSLVEKAAVLAVLDLGEHWFVDSVEATKAAYDRTEKPKGPRGAYFHGVLESKCAELGKGKLNSLLLKIDLSPIVNVKGVED